MKFNNLLSNRYVKILVVIMIIISIYSFLFNNKDGFELPKGMVIQTGRPNETRQNCTGKARTTCEKDKKGTVVCFNKCESVGEKLQRKREERSKKIEKLGWFERNKQKVIIFSEDASKKMGESYNDLKDRIQGKTKLAK
jgi:hypothetical protein